MKKSEICVLFGGQSSEYEVSLHSAYSVFSAIREEKYLVHKIGITRSGEWLLFDGELSEIIEDSWYKNLKNKPICVDFYKKCLLVGGQRIYPKAVLPIMHGEYGEDGRVQALFELLGSFVVGVPSASASLCMDKYLCKSVAMRECIPVAPYIAVRRGQYKLSDLISEIGQSISDLFVKPTLGGSSVGISHIHSPNELEGAIDSALEHSDMVLIEECIKGRECEVALLEKNGELVISEVGEISYESDFYDYETKYHSSRVGYNIPARISRECRDTCRYFAKKLFYALGCRGMCRIDFFVKDNGEIFFNEVNAIPGFTEGSMYPMLMKNEGYALPDLIDTLITDK